MFVRPLSGRNFAGIESHVRLPITTALCFSGSVVAIVTSRKYAMSPGRRQGIPPSFPIPQSFEAATTTLHEGAIGFSQQSETEKKHTHRERERRRERGQGRHLSILLRAPSTLVLHPSCRSATPAQEPLHLSQPLPAVTSRYEPWLVKSPLFSPQSIV
eukprot:COSAG02_NODE_13_length_57813_cov_14.298276_53_plen_157_part_01